MQVFVTSPMMLPTQLGPTSQSLGYRPNSDLDHVLNWRLTEVAATDSTIDAVDDTYFHLCIDARDLTDIKFYINGVETSDGETKKLDAATGPLLAIAHIEKTNNDTTAEIRVKNMTVRSTDLA